MRGHHHHGSLSYDDAPMVIPSAAGTPITAAQAGKASAELAGMKRSLTSWLRYRAINDRVASGCGNQVPNAVLKRPGAIAPPAAVVRANLQRGRMQDEHELATNLHRLLSEVFDPGDLPEPDVSRDPDVAAKLAAIAVSGVLPGQSPTPSAVGFVWMWPAVVVVGVIALVITTAIRSSADVAKEREKLECIKSGKCTDYGFWLKIGGVAAVAWFAWDKLGVREKIRGRRSPAGRR